MSADLENTNRSWSWRWVLGVVAAAAVAWFFLGPPRVVEQPKTPTPAAQQPQTSAPPAQQPQTPVPPAPEDSANLQSSLDSALAGVKASLQGIKDGASAKAALPQLEKEAAELDKLRERSLTVPADSESALAALVASARPALDGLFDKVLAIPGVDSIAKPAIDTLRTKLDVLSKALPFRVRQETK
jgi:hypothetical protein